MTPLCFGRSVQLGTEHVTVVGVMREGFAFPIAHDVWTPLRIVNDAHAPRSGPAISVFGLLAPGATLDTAQVELTAVGQRVASEQPATHAQLQPHVAPYAMLDGPSEDDEMAIVAASIYFFAVMLLVLICSNVALLLFARAATRESELTVRTALGASRSRIVAQMFAEALVLGGVAAVVGLAAAHIALNNWGLPFLEANLGRLPFWYDVSLSPTTVLFALGAHRARLRDRRCDARAQGDAPHGIQAEAGHGRGWRTAVRRRLDGVIVVQVAVTVAFPAVVYVEQGQLRHIQTFDAGFAAEEYLAVQLAMETPVVAGANGDSDSPGQRAAFASSIQELRRRVAAEPGVVGVTFADWIPRVPDRPWDRIELPDVTVTPRAEPFAAGNARRPRRWVNVGRIEPSYFEVLETPILAGRAFAAADLAPGANVAIVDQGFVEEVLQGRNPIGQQLRFAHDPKRYRRQAPQSVDRDSRRREGARDGLTPGEGTRRGAVPSCDPGPIRPGVHDGARSG